MISFLMPKVRGVKFLLKQGIAQNRSFSFKFFWIHKFILRLFSETATEMSKRNVARILNRTIIKFWSCINQLWWPSGCT